MTKLAKKKYVLTFPPQSGDKPLSSQLVKDFDLDINILKAEVRPGKTGSLLLELSGATSNIKKGIAFLESHDVSCEPLKKKIHFNQAECINCGNCTAVCFAKALTMDKESWELKFKPEKCIVCELCVTACPMGLFQIDFHY